MSPIIGNVASEGLKPTAPTIGTATVSGSTGATVSYTPSTYLGKSGSVTYTVVSSPDGITSSGTSPVTLTGLTTGTGYTFYVYATTNYGVVSDNSSSSNSVTPVVLSANYVYYNQGTSTMYYSADLSSWTAISPTQPFANALYVNSKFYVNSYTLQQQIGAISTNGITWTRQPQHVAYNGKILYFNNKFVSRGWNKTVYVSTDFTTWTAGNAAIDMGSNPNPVLNYFGGKWWVNSGDINGPSILMESSTDGITWQGTTISGPSMPGAGYWYIGGYFNSNFWAAQAYYGSISSVFKSTNGVSWTSVSLPASIDSLYDTGARIVNGKYILISASSGTVLSSTNGTTWTIGTNAGTGFQGPLSYAAGKYVGMNYDYGTSNCNAVVSTDGINFSLGSKINTSTPTILDVNGNVMSWYYSSIIYGNKFVINAYASDYTNYPPTSHTVFSTSTDAVTWSAWSAELTRNDNPFQKMLYASGRYAIYGSGSSDQYNLAYSTNGTSWTKVIGPSVDYQGLTTTVNNMFVWLGYIDGITYNVYTSTDAVTWTQRSVQTTGYWDSWAYGNSIYISADYNNGFNAISSTNLTSWTGTTLSGAYFPQNATYWAATNGTTGVYVPQRHYNGALNILSTTNGTTWTTGDQQLYSYISVSNVVYGNGVFVFCGDNGYTYVSTNGVNWTEYNLPDGSNSNWPNSLQFSGTKFYALGYSYANTIYTSTDGVTWTANTSQDSFASYYQNDGGVAIIGKV